MKNLNLNNGREERLNPRRTSRNYWVLKSMRVTLEKIIKSFDNNFEKILDFGCGNKPYKNLFENKCNLYFGADIKGNQNADIIILDDGRLPLADNSFDCVLSTQVLEHVENPKLYLSEAYRILTLNGILILSTHGIWKYHPDPTDYWRWTSDGLKKIILEQGFIIEKIYSVQTLPSIALQLWLDATLNKVPKMLQKIYSLFFQLLMELIDKITHIDFSDNASIFIVIAKKHE